MKLSKALGYTVLVKVCFCSPQDKQSSLVALRVVFDLEFIGVRRLKGNRMSHFTSHPSIHSSCRIFKSKDNKKTEINTKSKQRHRERETHFFISKNNTTATLKKLMTLSEKKKKS